MGRAGVSCRGSSSTTSKAGCGGVDETMTWHAGHLTRLPACSSGMRRTLPQAQLRVMGMATTQAGKRNQLNRKRGGGQAPDAGALLLLPLLAALAGAQAEV